MTDETEANDIETLDDEQTRCSSHCSSLRCRFGLHRWIAVGLSFGQIKRGVQRMRECRSCGRRQISKSLYKTMLNPSGFRDIANR